MQHVPSIVVVTVINMQAQRSFMSKKHATSYCSTLSHHDMSIITSSRGIMRTLEDYLSCRARSKDVLTFSLLLVYMGTLRFWEGEHIFLEKILSGGTVLRKNCPRGTYIGRTNFPITPRPLFA